VQQPATPAPTQAAQIPQAAQAPNTAPTNTNTPPIGKKKSPLLTILFVFLGLILIVAYAIVWALVFGMTLPFKLPF